MFEDAKPIPGHDGYFITPSGDVYSTRLGYVRKMKTHRYRGDYLKVGMTKNRKVVHLSVHRLVLMTFVGPSFDGAVARHLDGDRSNNQLNNLAWGTLSDNTRDAVRHGTHNCNRGETNGSAKLTEDQVRYIRTRVHSGESLGVLAELFNVRENTIRRVIKRKTWKHLLDTEVNS